MTLRPPSPAARPVSRRDRPAKAALTRELMTYAGHTRIAFKRQDPNNVILD